jgi:Fic family protein
LRRLRRAAAEACQLHGELAQAAQRLEAVAPKLRAKGALAALLGDDAVSGAAEIAGLSDRGLRRLFDRLVELGALRELTGRPTFRLYGL